MTLTTSEKAFLMVIVQATAMGKPVVQPAKVRGTNLWALGNRLIKKGLVAAVAKTPRSARVLCLTDEALDMLEGDGDG